MMLMMHQKKKTNGDGLVHTYNYILLSSFPVKESSSFIDLSGPFI